MICPHCGKENPEHAEVCGHCGEPLPPASQPPRLLSQIQGLIPAEPVILSGQRRTAEALPLDSLPEVIPSKPGVETASMARDEGMAGEPTPGPGAPGDRTLWIVAGLMFLAVMIGSYWPTLTPTRVPIRPSVKNAYAFIEILRPTARVLIAWDYDPATQGELQLLAQPILHHLQRKRVETTFMSLGPFGPNVAQDTQALTTALAPIIAQAAPVPAQIGFIPGANAALRSVAISPVNTSSQPRLTAQDTGIRPTQDINAFDLIIQITASPTSSREWVEQVASRSDVPLIVAASGAAAPLLRPYEQTRQIRVLLAGYPDALAYEYLLSQQGPAIRQAASQTLLTGLFLGVVLFAALRSLFRK